MHDISCATLSSSSISNWTAPTERRRREPAPLTWVHGLGGGPAGGATGASPPAYEGGATSIASSTMPPPSSPTTPLRDADRLLGLDQLGNSPATPVADLDKAAAAAEALFAEED